MKTPTRLTEYPLTAKKRKADAFNLVFSYLYIDSKVKPIMKSIGGTRHYLFMSPAFEYKTEEYKTFLEIIAKSNHMTMLDISCPKGSAPKRQTYEVLKGFQELGKLDSLRNISFVELDENFEEMPKVFDILANMPSLRYAHFSGKEAQAFAEQFLKLQQLESVSLSYDSYAACLPNVLSLPKLKELRLDYAPELETAKFLDNAGQLESITIQIYQNHTPNPEKAMQYVEQLQKKLPHTQVYVY